VLWFAATVMVLGHAAAQDPIPSVLPTMDVGDLWRMAHHRPEPEGPPSHQRYLVAAPSIGSKPSTGLNAGFSSSMAFFTGDSATTHISSFSAGLKVSQKKQTNLGSRVAIFTDHDRWFLLGDNRMAWTSQNTYELGTDAPSTSGTNAKFDSVRLFESAYRAIGHGMFVGGGLNVSSHSDVRPGKTGATSWDASSYVSYADANGFAVDHQRSAGTSAGFRLDTRDSAINADRGWLGAATYRTFFKGFLGGDSNWQELSLDVRTYKKLTNNGRKKLAFWFLGDMVTGGQAPFFDLPTTGADGRSARGYSEGRYRGDHLLYGETEYRQTLTSNGLIGFVAFANATTVSDALRGTSLFNSVAPAGGAGLRVLLNKRSKTNLCTDYGWGRDGSRGFYLSIQEAF
jgi:outer membrane protein assembly factor BamA